MVQNPEQEWFGERRVSAAEKTGLVHGVFDNVADRYDLMNDCMSLGVHRLWKDQFIKTIRPRPGLKYLDVAGGTGDIAFRLRKEAGAGADITLCDLTRHMLQKGRNRAIDRGWIKDFKWVTGNAEALPVAASSVDVYTISFGLRNVTRIDDALKEAVRVLRPGGRFFCLEFSRITDPLLAKIYDRYAVAVIPRLGQFIAKDRGSYQYLIESIKKFPPQHVLAARMKEAGLAQVKYTNLSAGIAAIHQGVRL